MNNEENELLELCDEIIATATPEQIALAEETDLADLFAQADAIICDDND